MAFPLSPVNGQIAVVNGIRYSYNSTIRSWTRLISSAKFTAAAGSPSEPALGDQWYDTNTDILYEWIYDGYTGYWIDIQSLGQTGNIVSIVDSTLQGNIVVGSNTTYSIGASTGYLRNLYAANVFTISLTSNTLVSSELSAVGNGNVIISSNLIPTSNVTYNLGNTDKRFKDLYLSGNTIYLGGATLSTDGANLTITNPQGGTFSVIGSSTGINTATYSNISANVLTVGNVTLSSNILNSGNLTFLGTGRRILADFNNATAQNRAAFQTSTDNSNTTLNIAPSGTGTTAAIELDTDSSLTNGAIGALKIVTGSDVRIESAIRGSGSYLPLTLYTGGVERIRVNTNGDTTLAANITVNGSATLGDSSSDSLLITAAPSIGGAGLGMGMGFRNRIINGAMAIDQRNAGASKSVSGAENVYTLDRWAAGAIGGGSFTVQQSSTVPEGFANSLVVTVTGTDTSLATNDRYSFYQYIEGFNTADLNFGLSTAQSVTISFRVRSSVTGNFGVYISNSAFNRTIANTFTVNSVDTWETKTITFSGDITGTWQKTNSIGIVLGIQLSAGTDYQGTANTWTAGAVFTTSSQTNFMATNGATFYITGVQLEKGSTATAFDYRPYGTELQLCQRYYWIINSPQFGGAGETQVGMFTFQGTNTAYVILQNPVQMRGAPIISVSGNFQWTQNGTQTGVTNISGVLSNPYNDMLGINVISGLTVGTTGRLSIAGSASGVIQFSAEL
jgi:hypothetical protein